MLGYRLSLSLAILGIKRAMLCINRTESNSCGAARIFVFSLPGKCNERIEISNEYSGNNINYASDKHLQRVTIIYILTLAQFAEIRIERYHRV